MFLSLKNKIRKMGEKKEKRNKLLIMQRLYINKLWRKQILEFLQENPLLNYKKSH
jgi:hypothetical protein